MTRSKRHTPWVRAVGETGPRRRVPGAIADEIGTAIVRGRFKPGQTLAGEIEASKKWQVSRGAYREAIGLLVAKGLVQSRPKAGTTVSPLSRWHLLDPEVLGWAFKSEPDPSLVWSLFELRMCIEPAAAALAAERRTYADLDSMHRAIEVMGQLGLVGEDGREADRLFHQTLLDAANNAFFSSLSPGIAAAIYWTTIFKTRASSLPRDPLPAHVRVFEAVRAKNARAARSAMKLLVQMGLDDTKIAVQAAASHGIRRSG